jgi:glycerol uptake facilitator-like aquaporin
MIAQVLGCFFALTLGFLLRVSMAVPNTNPPQYYFLPGVKGLTPPILKSADGNPAFGQVMLAEIIGSLIFTLVILYAKRFQYHYKYNRVVSAIPIPIALIGIY